jgi:hypothetical protein
LPVIGRGPLAQVAKTELIEKIRRGNDVLAREAKLWRINEVGDEFADPHRTPIERPLAERVALCWAEVHSADARIFGRLGEALDTRRAAFLDQYRDRAHRRYLTALKTLRRSASWPSRCSSSMSQIWTLESEDPIPAWK